MCRVVGIQTVLVVVELVDVAVHGGGNLAGLQIVICKVPDDLVHLYEGHVHGNVVDVERQEAAVDGPGFFEELDLG